MARVVKYPTCNPPFGKTPLKHGAKVEITSLMCQRRLAMDPITGAINCTGVNDYNFSKSFVVSQIGAAFMFQDPISGMVVGANAGYIYGFRAEQNQAALRVYYHEDSGAIEFESCHDQGKFLAFDRRGNIIPLNGKTEGVARRFAVRLLEEVAVVKQAQSTLGSLMSAGKKLAQATVQGGTTQLNFEKNKLRGIMGHGARVRLRCGSTGRYLAIMDNGIVHGNGDQSDVMIVQHCHGVLRYSFQSEKYKHLFLCVTLDNITWAMSNQAGKENPMMVWEVEKCRSDGAILFRRNTMLNTFQLYQYLGIAPNGKPTATLIDPEEMGNIYIEPITVTMHAATNAPVPAHTPVPAPAYTEQPPAYTQPGPYGAPPQAGYAPAPIVPVAAGSVNYGSAPPAPEGGAPETPLLPPGALLFDGSIVGLRNTAGFITVSNGKLSSQAVASKDCDWRVHNAGMMEFKFENCKSGGFIVAKGSDVKMGGDGPEASFQVTFNPNGSVTFQSVATDGVYIGNKESEIFLEIC